ncbi:MULTISPECIES: DoxX family protein [Nostoc]|uniref:DoxX family protein n=1 Tax=Nostoc paludosum FACHB-159 TaxID=2692908 RepID=A0ABR8KLR2_9NOSO|nr:MULTISPECIES: DoxX family protein [Nostoc]MBD2677549.1 DoxX family protein [Nostoc sp. FACHB-857]MBD2739638.1 DoxX family protein [Nostoc paludosum FACHB-159]
MNQHKERLRVILAIAIILVGVTHFLIPEPYVKIMPPQLPYPLELVYLSGFYEILGGIGLLVPPVSQAAAWGLIALFIAVFPANINMAVNHIKLEYIPDSPWVHVIRLPLQAVLIAWAWWYTKPSDLEKQVSIIPKSMIPKELELK